MVDTIDFIKRPVYYSKVILDMIIRNYRYYKSLVLGKNKDIYNKVFELMLQDNKLKSSLFWEKIGKQIKKDMIGAGLKNFKRDYCNTHFSERVPKTQLEISALWQLLNYNEKIDSLDILKKVEEPLIGNPELTNLNGKKVTWDFLLGINEFYSILNNFSIKKKDSIVICEIGCGYGRLAHLFTETFPNSHYILVDMPTSLIIAYYYLCEIYKDKDIINPYESSRNCKDLNRNFFSSKRISFLTPDQFYSIKKGSVDLFINIDSFQEMTPDIIKEYFKQIINLNGSYLYLKNSKDKVHNLVDTKQFSLINYPHQMGLKVKKSQISPTFPDMVEQFVILK